ncbi:MAG: hypothetical protein CK425_03935 [Parachlamydia sp.]|nr:MAG: hypothetical protein CK425_03935 [Parachlamydia sp.]
MLTSDAKFASNGKQINKFIKDNLNTRIITFTHLDKSALEKVSAAIDNMFADPAARNVLENFLPKF